jgi:hypothetical protein
MKMGLFAHSTDIYISQAGDHNDLLSGWTVDFLNNAIEPDFVETVAGAVFDKNGTVII